MIYQKSPASLAGLWEMGLCLSACADGSGAGLPGDTPWPRDTPSQQSCAGFAATAPALLPLRSFALRASAGLCHGFPGVQEIAFSTAHM